MKEDSSIMENASRTPEKNEGSCAGGVGKGDRLFRRLKSTRDGRVKITVPAKVQNTSDKKYDPSAWYVCIVKRHKERDCRDFINTPGNFDFKVEAYAATQPKVEVDSKGRPKNTSASAKSKEQVVIHGKLFVRVDMLHRVDVLKKCLYLVSYMKDPLLELTDNGFTDFARVPDKEIKRLRGILEMADDKVEYMEFVPQVADEVEVIGGLLSRSALFKDLKGKVEMLNGSKYATVVLEGIGGLKFKLPVRNLKKTNNVSQ